MNNKTIIEQLERNTIVDNNTGEIIEDVKTIKQVNQITHETEPPYIKFYIQDILYTQDMPRGLTNVVYSLASRATYANDNPEEGLLIILNSYIKSLICKELNYENVRSLNNDLSKLAKGNIIKRLGTDTYQLNPYLFGKGEWKNIDKIRMIWDYNIKGRTYDVTIKYKDKTTEKLKGESNKNINTSETTEDNSVISPNFDFETKVV